MKKVCIVVPVYKQKLNFFEKISLQQLLRILGEFPICFVQPASMKIDYEELSGWEYKVCKFDEGYFQNTATYSELMLSPFFYENFLDYEYMLVYQLDSFVFSNRLSEFCDMDYDYIGGPQHHSWTKEVVVGNGGFSLRKISTVLSIIRKYNEIVEDIQQRDFFRKWEDNFFSYCGRKEDVKFTVPDILLANTFSVVDDTGGGMQQIPVKGLPFGTHAWHRSNFEFWRDIIEIYGYQTDKLVAENNVNMLEMDQNERYKKYFLNVLREFPADVKREILKDLGVKPDETYIMWGAGYFGKRILKILLDLGLNISVIFDIKPKERRLYGIVVKYPDFMEVLEQKRTVLISSEDYKEEIEQELVKNGCGSLIKISDLFSSKWEGIQEKYRKVCPEVEGVTVPFRFIVDRSWIADIVRRM